eukprot:1310584-Pleurochrysis_carterae.AAC.1
MKKREQALLLNGVNSSIVKRESYTDLKSLIRYIVPEAMMMSARRGSALKTNVNQSFWQISRSGMPTIARRRQTPVQVTGTF